MEIRDYAQKQLAILPPEMQRLVNPEVYWVGLSERLAERKREEMRRFFARG
jgi:hypothetical protein